MCGEAVWSVVLARKESFNANSSVWLDDGKYQEIDDLNCLVPYSVQQADLLEGTVPDREHYVNLGVTVPSRLESEWLKMTPENFDKMPEEDLMSMIDRELLWLDEILAESPLVSKPVSDVITVDWILYLADDFHWRGVSFCALKETIWRRYSLIARSRLWLLAGASMSAARSSRKE